MTFGVITFAFGYVLFYWGLHHFPQYKNERYSLWELLGFGVLFKNAPVMTPGQPIKFKAS